MLRNSDQLTLYSVVLEDSHKQRPFFSIQSPTSTHPDYKTTLDSAEGRKYRKEVEGAGSLFKHNPIPHVPDDDDSAEGNPNEEDKDQHGDSKGTEEPTKPKEKSTDPLRWFGILVPPALRTAQSTFIGAVEGPIPQLATIAKDLRTQEIEIGRVKKQIKKL
jgi:hypothetical protein